MQEIIHRNKSVVLCEAGLELLSKYVWWWSGGYLVRKGHSRNGKKTLIPFHRELLDFPLGAVDHINRITYDNRLANLRVCHQGDNAKNTKHQKNNTTGYKGVAFHKAAQRYRAFIKVQRKQIHLGLFDCPVAAALAYDAAALKYFGEFAATNLSLGNFQGDAV